MRIERTVDPARWPVNALVGIFKYESEDASAGSDLRNFHCLGLQPTNQALAIKLA